MGQTQSHEGNQSPAAAMPAQHPIQQIAFTFLQSWGKTADIDLEDLTDSTKFKWRDYLGSLPEPTQSVVLQLDVTEFHIAKIGMGISGPIYIVTRSDGSQVHLHPQSNCETDVMYVDRKGPRYYGHLARKEPWPDGCCGPPVAECKCRLCPDLPAERHGQPTAGVIATAAGMGSGLTDLMTNADARSRLEAMDVPPGRDLDLSDGTTFPWVRWVHNQPAIVKEFAGGVTKFSAACITFTRRTGAFEVSGQVFRMDRLDAPPLALLPGNKSVAISLLVTDEWGTYPVDHAMQNNSEEVYMKAVRNVAA